MAGDPSQCDGMLLEVLRRRPIDDNRLVDRVAQLPQVTGEIGDRASAGPP